MNSISDPAALAALIERLGRLRPDTERRWGTLSAGEMLCHLADCAASVLGPSGGPPPPARPIYRWVALYSALPWPHGLKTPQSVDPHRGGSRPGDFEADRARAIGGLRALADASPDAFANGHRRFGRMRAQDWWHWAYRHTDHHLRQFGL